MTQLASPRGSLLFGSLCALLVAGCPPAAEDPDAGGGGALDAPVVPRGVELALDAAERTLRTRGLTRRAGQPSGFLLERRAQVATLPIRAGRCYTFVAAASPGIEDLDVLVFDAEGAQVAYDTARSGHAATRLCPPQTGTYYVAVRAAVGNGVFALRWFEGASGTGGALDDVWPLEAVGPR